MPATAVWPPDASWSCLRAIHATIEWTNGATGGGDLYLGLEAGPGFSVVGHDEQQLFIDGAHQESVSAPPPPDPTVLAGLVLVVYSDWASLSLAGLPVHATVAFEV
jgi:hypothetical protein